MLCPISELCAGSCNMLHSEGGAIKINRLQEIAVRIFKEMNVILRKISLYKFFIIYFRIY